MEDLSNTKPFSDDKNSVVKQPTLSRRSFLKLIATTAAAVTFGQVGIKPTIAHDDQEQIKGNDINKGIQKENPRGVPQLESKNVPDEFTSTDNAIVAADPRQADIKQVESQEGQEIKRDSYSETVVEQGLMMLAKTMANSVFEKLKIEHGNKSLSENEIIKYLKEKPVEGIMKVGVLYPMLEETLFRLLPSKFIDKNDKSNCWEVGIPVSAIFALTHNISENDKKEWKLQKSVPISQFMGGLFYWYLMREKGYSHAVLAHSTNNSVPFSIGALLFKIYPEEKAERISKKMFCGKGEDNTPNKGLPPSDLKL